MSRNNLFVFINKYFKQVNKVFVTLEKKKNNQNHPYYLYSLPVAHKPIEIFDADHPRENRFTVREQHLSFYLHEDKSNAHFSEYHYTATLEDLDHNFYKLHVYFNGKDQIIIAPKLEIIEDRTKKPVSIDPFILDLFASLAVNQTQHSIEKLRSMRRNKIAELFQSYQALHALPKKDVQKIDEILDRLENLSELDTTKNYSCIKKIYKVKKAAELANKSEPLQLLDKKTNQEKFTETKQSKPAQKPVKTVTKRKNRKNSEDDIKFQISEFIVKFNNFELNLDVSTLNLLVQELNFLQLMIDETQNTTSINNSLDEVIVKIDAYGEQMLLRSLTASANFQDAKMLAKYLSDEMAENLFVKALSAGDAKKLAFILESTEFPLNTFFIENKPIICYLLEDLIITLEYNKFIECLSLLIKHDASIFINDSKGLPIVYKMVGFQNDFLIDALIDNADKTINSPIFWKKIIQTLNNFVANNPEHEEIAVIKGVLPKFEMLRTTFQILGQGERAKIAKYNMVELIKNYPKEFIESGKKLPKEFVDKLISDVEINQALIASMQAFAEFKACLNTAELRIFSPIENKLAQNVSPIDSISMDNWETVKADIVQQYNGSASGYNRLCVMLGGKNKDRNKIRPNFSALIKDLEYTLNDTCQTTVHNSTQRILESSVDKLCNTESLQNLNERIKNASNLRDIEEGINFLEKFFDPSFFSKNKIQLLEDDEVPSFSPDKK